MAQIAEPAVAAPPAAPKVVISATNLAMPSPKYVVGLDFGTTYSGFSFTEYKDIAQGDGFSENVQLYEIEKWPDVEIAYEKTPTVSLYNEGNQMLAWGWTAEFQKKEFPKSFLAHKFKLHLAELEKGEPDCRPPLPPFAKGHDDGVVTVISQYLRQLKAFILARMNFQYNARNRDAAKPVAANPDAAANPETTAKPVVTAEPEAPEVAIKEVVKQEDIRWCLTVPALWTDKAKIKMNRAAQLAGLVQGRSTPVGEGSPHPLQIVLEPEAASLYCLHWLKKFGANYDINSAYLVVDLGGGTADLAMHGFKIVGEDVKLVELQLGTGGLCGGSHVDDLFYEYLKQHAENWDEETSKMSNELHKLRGAWEDEKRKFNGDIEDRLILMPRKICQLLVKHFPDAVNDGGINIPGATMTGFFTRVILKIKHLVDRQIESLRQNQDPQIALKPITVFLVGGFSESEYVRKCINEIVAAHNGPGKPTLRIVAPTKPGIAIARGACLYGLNPHAFHSRCVRRSYALEAYRRALPTDPKKELIKRPDGKVEVKGCATSIYEGKIVEEGRPFKMRFNPHNPGDQKITIPLLTWTDPDVNAPDPVLSSDTRIKPTGINLEVIMPPADELKNDTVIVEMEFNGPTISVKGYPEENVDMAVTVLLNLDDDAVEE